MERVQDYILNKYLLGYIDEVDYNNLKLNNIKQGALVSS